MNDLQPVINNVPDDFQLVRIILQCLLCTVVIADHLLDMLKYPIAVPLAHIKGLAVSRVNQAVNVIL